MTAMRRYHQHQFYYTHTVYYTVHYYCVVVIYLPYVVKDIAEKEKKVLGSNLNPLYLSLYSGKRGIATTAPLDTNTYQLHIFNKYKYYMVDRCGTYTYHHPYVGCVCTYTYSAIDTRSKTRYFSLSQKIHQLQIMQQLRQIHIFRRTMYTKMQRKILVVLYKTFLQDV